MKRINSILLLMVIFVFFGCMTANDPEQLTNSEIAGFKLVSKLKTPGFCEDVAIDNNIVYLSQGEGGLAIIDISNPLSPIIKKSLFQDLRGYSKKIAIKGTTVYLAAGSYGVSVVDASNPDNPTVVATNLEMRPAKDVMVFGNFLFTSISEQGVKVADISEPTTPDIAGRVQTLPGYSRSNTMTKDSILITSCGEMGLGFTNMKNLKSGFETFSSLKWFDIEGYTEATALSDDGRYLIAACGNSGIIIIDISNVIEPKIISSLMPGGYANDVLVYKDKVLVSSSNRGLQIISIAEVSNPKLLGTIPLNDITGITMNSKYVVAADETEGMVLIQLPE